jgi:hypothetical protein
MSWVHHHLMEHWLLYSCPAQQWPLAQLVSAKQHGNVPGHVNSWHAAAVSCSLLVQAEATPTCHAIIVSKIFLVCVYRSSERPLDPGSDSSEDERPNRNTSEQRCQQHSRLMTNMCQAPGHSVQLLGLGVPTSS